ncbi:MAG: OmpH family outer membrane protein [Planctomycetia bacterium]|nr:OmpH family outer membrane protein [Planctomycetia bacterium]
MRMPLAAAAAVISCVGLLAVSNLSAQRPASSATPRSGVALVDVAGISQKCARLTQSLEALKHEYESNAASFKKEADVGNQLTEKVRQMPAGSPERKQLEQEVLKRRADFELHGKRITEDARERETRLYVSMFRELNDELARYAQANGVQLILRYDVAPLDLSDPRAVLQEIQKPIVYQRDMDVTPTVLDLVNRRSGPLGSTSKTATQSGPTKTR